MNVHDGQKKLMLGTKLFLAKCVQDNLVSPDEKVVVVCVGAAPGTHLLQVVGGLPNWEFHLFDAAQFDSSLSSCSNVKLVPTLLMKRHSAEYSDLRQAGQKVLFMSDIRSSKHSKNGFDQSEITKDMLRQQRWVQAIQPTASWLKFRFPFPESGTEYVDGEKFQYLKGDIILQAHAPPNSSETRLYVANPSAAPLPVHAYDVQKYDDQLCRFNNVERPEQDYDRKLADHAESMFQQHVMGSGQITREEMQEAINLYMPRIQCSRGLGDRNAYFVDF